MKSESEIQQLIQLEAPKNGDILLRNNSGALKDAEGRVVRYGLGNTSVTVSKQIKSSDLIGITKIIITPDMVGKTVGVFTAIEVKRQDWKFKPDNERDRAQNNFIQWIKSCGGIAGFVNSVESYLELVRK
jgi:hypothetical protein